MTAAAAREAFGAEFVGAEGFLNTPTYGLPPRFLVDALHDCIGGWQTGTMDVPAFDDYVARGRAGYAALTGLPVESVAMGGHGVGGARSGRCGDSGQQPRRGVVGGVHQHHLPVRRPGGSRGHGD